MVRVKAKVAAVELAGKAYRKGIERVIATTAMLPEDLDDKALRLLDFLQHRSGRAAEAVAHLERNLQGRRRQDITNWNAYVYTILRGFDEGAYVAFKTADGRCHRRPQGADQRQVSPPQPSFAFNPKAREFVPGRAWSPEPDAGAGAGGRAGGGGCPAASSQGQAAAADPAGAAVADVAGEGEQRHPERTPEAEEETGLGRSEFSSAFGPAAAGLAPAPASAATAVCVPRDLGSVITGIAADPRVRTVGTHAVGGALLLGMGGGAGGLAAGGALGAACGLLPALLTFGLSIPIGAALGSGAGLFAGVAAGGTAGLVGGGILGYRKARQTATST